MPHPIPTTLVLCIALMSGCASKQPLSTDATVAAQRGAAVAGAEDDPQATLALQLSHESLARAEALHANGKKEQAKSQLLRAEADAELAIVLAQAETQKAEAVAARDRVLKVRNDR